MYHSDHPECSLFSEQMTLSLYRSSHLIRALITSRETVFPRGSYSQALNCKLHISVGGGDKLGLITWVLAKPVMLQPFSKATLHIREAGGEPAAKKQNQGHKDPW